MQLKIKATDEAVSRYQELLLEDRSLETLAHALDLTERVIGVSFVVREPEQPTVEPREYPISENLREEYRQRLEELNLELKRQAEAKRINARFDSRDRYVFQLAWKAIVYLTLPIVPGNHPSTVRFQLSGNIDFLNDIRSIVFQTAADELLPTLKGAKWADVRNTLIDALWFHVNNFWTKNPAHQHYLRSIFFEAVGYTDEVGEELRSAYRATDASEPDHFVKAYTYWSFLVDHQRWDDAKSFALAVLRECPRDFLADAQDMVDASYALIYEGRLPRQSRD